MSNANLHFNSTVLGLKSFGFDGFSRWSPDFPTPQPTHPSILSPMKKSTPIILFFAAIAVRLGVFFATRYAVDDAFITFRYAENLANGNGLVYNLGERVLGTTTPLFTLLIALFNLIGIGSMTAALCINLTAAGLTTVILYRWSQHLDLGKFAILPAVIYIVFPRSVICDIAGMETALFTLLVTLGLYLLFRRKHFAAITIASLATVARPEGWALLALIVGVVIIRDRRQLLLKAIPILLIAGNWLLIAYLYFGAIVPNSLTAKMALYSGYERFSSWQNLAITLGLNSPFGWIIWPLFLLGLIFAFRKDKLLGIIAIWCGAYLVALIVSGTHVFFWYPAPVYPTSFVIVTIAVVHLLRHVPIAKAAHTNWLPAVVSILVIAASLIHLIGRFDYLRQEMATYHDVHITAADYLNQHAAPNDRVLAEDIGYLGYYFRGRIIDRDGLVTPQAAAYNRSGEYRRFADSVNAEWLFIDPDYPTALPIVTAPDFAERYEMIPLPDAGDNPCHQLYRRTER
jgi:arabinofuranosyltransferase